MRFICFSLFRVSFDCTFIDNSSHFITLHIYIRRARKAYFVFTYEACPAVLYKTFSPFRVGRFIFISLLINNNYVFFDGCRPLVLICFCEFRFLLWVSSPIRNPIISCILPFCNSFPPKTVPPVRFRAQGRKRRLASFYFCFNSNFEKVRKMAKNEENPRKPRFFRPASFKTKNLEAPPGISARPRRPEDCEPDSAGKRDLYACEKCGGTRSIR